MLGSAQIQPIGSCRGAQAGDGKAKRTQRHISEMLTKKRLPVSPCESENQIPSGLGRGRDMFWRLGFVTASPIDQLLDSDNFTLESLLDESDLIQECKQSNEKLVD
jgi:hypothetical protein